MRFLTGELGAEQLAFTHRLMPPESGGKGAYGHRHRTQEEIYFVISGKLKFKLDDEILNVAAGTAVRVAPEVVRSIWNDGPHDAELVICSVQTGRTARRWRASSRVSGRTELVNGARRRGRPAKVGKAKLLRQLWPI
jgi:mannose-6-phosphate isomerase-like protein (cupin superfamily)